MPTGNSYEEADELDCDAGSALFTDDNSDHENYKDDAARRDTIVICPEDEWHRVKVTFTEFDVAAGDTLSVFDGDLDGIRAALLEQAIRNKRAGGIGLDFGATLAQLDALLAANPGLAEQLFNDHENSVATGSGTGVGGAGFNAMAAARSGTSVSDAFGGWVAASCDPLTNNSGCLTFIFDTNGDRAKGAGWEAWAECEKKDIELKSVEDLKDVRLVCGGDAFATVTIKTPYVIACSDTLDNPSDSILVTITNETGVTKTRRMSSAKAAVAADKEWENTFGIGTYRVTYDLISDPHEDKRVTQTFAVIEPTMTCNDEVNTVFGAACQLVITPDMVLEDSCSNLSTDSIFIMFDGKVLAAGDLAGLPVVTKDTLEAVGAGLCNGELTVRKTGYYR